MSPRARRAVEFWVSEEFVRAVARAVMKAERVYRDLQPDAHPDECWLEVDVAVAALDAEVPGWRGVERRP